MKRMSVALFAAFALYAQGKDREKAIQAAWGRIAQGGEVYFSFPAQPSGELVRLGKLVSLDRVEGDRVYAYANRKEWTDFIHQRIAFQVEQNPGDTIDPVCSDYAEVRGVPTFDKWPTYEGYLNLMKSYATNFPKLCTTFEIGKTVKDRSIQCLILTGEKQGPKPRAKPRIAQLGAIHGDEVVGTMVSFRTVNRLLSGYLARESRAMAILDNVEIWYVPFCNLDGTYNGGNQSVKGARRYNANNADLNRSFPTLKEAPAPDPMGPDGTQVEQQETKVLKAFLTENQFTLAADFHGGINGYIYPYTFGGDVTHCDKKFFVEFGKHLSKATLSSATVGSIPVGTAQEVVQYWAPNTLVDYYNIYCHAKGYTFEMGYKMIDAEDFNGQWDRFKDMYLKFYEGALVGVNGSVKDANTQQGISNVKVFVENHDKHNTWVYSGEDGSYFRPIASGTYTLTFSHQDYVSQTIPQVAVKDLKKVVLDVQLQPK